MAFLRFDRQAAISQQKTARIFSKENI